MAIRISSEIRPLGDYSTSATGVNAYPTHLDEYGKGGFVAIDTNGNDVFPEINKLIPYLRRKEGMLVYDVHGKDYYRCINVGSSVSDGTWEKQYFSGRYFHGATSPTASDIQLGERWFDTVVGSEYTYLPIAEGSTYLAWVDIDHIGVDNYVNAGGDFMTGTLTGTYASFSVGLTASNGFIGTLTGNRGSFTNLTASNGFIGTLTGNNAFLSNTLTIFNNGHTATYGSLGITLSRGTSSFNLRVQRDSGSTKGFSGSSQKIIDIQTDRDTSINSLSETNELQYGNDYLYFNKDKNFTKIHEGYSFANLNGGPRGIVTNSTPTPQTMLHTPCYPENNISHVRKIIRKFDVGDTWVNNKKYSLISNGCAFIGNFSEVGRARELNGLICYNEGISLGFSKWRNLTANGNNPTLKGNHAHEPSRIIDGTFVSRRGAKSGTLVLVGVTGSGSSQRLQVVSVKSAPPIQTSSDVIVDGLNNPQECKNIINEGYYNGYLFSCVASADPPLIYSGGQTSVGATAALIFGYSNWQADLINNDSFVGSGQMLVSYNMDNEDAQITGSYVSMFVPVNAGATTLPERDLKVSDLLVETFSSISSPPGLTSWARVWSVYNTNDYSSPHVHHAYLSNIYYDNSVGFWKLGRINLDGTYSSDPTAPQSLSNFIPDMTLHVDGINRKKTHYTFIRKGEYYDCDMGDGVGTTTYHNIYTGGHFEFNMADDGIKFLPGATTADYANYNNRCVGVPDSNNTNASSRTAYINSNYPQLFSDDGATYDITYNFPFIIYYKVRSSDGHIVGDPLSAKLPIFDYDKSTSNKIYLDRRSLPYGDYTQYSGPGTWVGPVDKAPIYSDTNFIGNTYGQLSAYSCFEHYDFTAKKMMLFVVGGTIDPTSSSWDAQDYLSVPMALRCAIGPTGTLLGGQTASSIDRWRKSDNSLVYPGSPNLYDATLYNVPKTYFIKESSNEPTNFFRSYPILAGRIEDWFAVRAPHSIYRSNVVRWVGFAYDNRDGGGYSWTSTGQYFQNQQYFRNVYGVPINPSNPTSLLDRDKYNPQIEVLTRCGLGSSKGAIVSMSWTALQSTLQTLHPPFVYDLDSR